MNFGCIREISASSSQRPEYTQPFGDVRNCPTTSLQKPNQPLYRMEVLPGIGFDNLRSIDMGQVLSYNYSQCQISSDGKYLLPDDVVLTAVKESHLETSAEYFDHWDEYKVTTATSISVHAGISGLVSSKLSTEYQTAKSHMFNEDSKMTRSQIRYKLYTIKMQPDAQLHPNFKKSLLDIAAHHQRNEREWARYLSELVVRDFGTHVVTSMDAGATIVHNSFLKSSFIADSSSKSVSVTASASAVFFRVLNVGTKFKFSTSESHQDDFMSNTTHSDIKTIGGPPFRSNFTLSDWEAGIDDSLVALDRSGVPLHYFITPNTLPELTPLGVQEVADSVYEAIARYYRLNTRQGCTDPKAKNFDFHANVNNGICDFPSNNYTFGGIYQTCTVDSSQNYKDLCTTGPHANQRNPRTGDFSCPNDYVAVKVHSGTITQVTENVPQQKCHHFGKIKYHCHDVYVPMYSKAHYDAYWCAAQPGKAVSKNSGYLFGGMYTSTTINPVTNTKGCPPYFITVNMGEDIKVCVSDDYERAYAASIPFGGFKSCEMGNPLAATLNSSEDSNWPQACPHAYAQHLISVIDGCEINYCVQMGSFTFKTVIPAHLPPFNRRPKHKVNDSELMTLVGANDQFWFKGLDGEWSQMPWAFLIQAENTTQAPHSPSETPLISSSTATQDPTTETDSAIRTDFHKPAGNTKGGTASNSAVIVLSVLVGIMAVTLAFIAIVWCRAKYRKYNTNGYENIHLDNNTT